MICILLPDGAGALGRFLAKELSMPFFSHREIAAQLAEMTGDSPALQQSTARQMLLQEAETWLRMGESCVLECAGADCSCPGLNELLQALGGTALAVAVPNGAPTMEEKAAVLRQLRGRLEAAQG